MAIFYNYNRTSYNEVYTGNIFGTEYSDRHALIFAQLLYMMPCDRSASIYNGPINRTLKNNLFWECILSDFKVWCPFELDLNVIDTYLHLNKKGTPVHVFI